MSIRTSLLLAVAAGIAGIVAAQAMPLAARVASPAGLLAAVSSGCGLGVHRGPFNDCIPFYPVYPIYPAYSDSGSKGYYYRGPVRARTNVPVQPQSRPSLSN